MVARIKKKLQIGARQKAKISPKTVIKQQKPVVIVFSTMSLATSVGAKIVDIEQKKGSSGNLDLIKKANNLCFVGYTNTKKYPSTSMTANKIKNVGNAVKMLLGGPVDPQYVLSMVMAGLNDIEYKVSPKNKHLISEIINAVRACCDCYLDNEDDEYDGNQDALDRYNSWLKYMNGEG